MSFQCPVCSKKTNVSETRKAPGGLRRRRRCVDLACEGRVTTLELEAPATLRKWNVPLMFVPKGQISKVIELLTRLAD